MPLFWLSLAFLGGILLGELLNWSFTPWLLLTGFFLVLVLVWSLLARRFPHLLERVPSSLNLPFPYLLLLIPLTLGGARYQLAQPELSPDFIAWHNDSGQEFIVEGVLVEQPDARDRYTNLRLRVERLHPAGELLFTPVGGLLLARISPGGEWHYGDRVRLQGELETPPEDEDFSYRSYLKRQGIYSYMPRARARLLLRGQGSPFYTAVYGLRERSLETVYNLFPDPEASLLAGILLGVETGIPEDVQDAFRNTGTAHIIAISGFNITILSAFFVFLFNLLLRGRRRFLAAGMAAVVIAIYAVLVGADAAVVRAAIMGSLSLLAALVGRRQDGLNTLTFVAALMALFNPDVLWDVGFQLSFMATLGLLLYAEPLSNAFMRLTSRILPDTTAQRLTRPVSEYFLFTFAAILTVLPVMIYHFQRLSLVSLLANPAILPAQPAVMILGGLAVILGLIHPPLGQLAALLAWPFVAYTIRIVELFDRIPGRVMALGEISLHWLILFYLVLFTWTFLGERIQKWIAEKTGDRSSTFKFLPTATLAVMGIFAVVVWRAALTVPDGRLHLTFIDVGSGDALLIQTPTGRNMLVDGGPSPSKLSDGLGRRLPITHRRLDFLVVAAAGDGQIAALPRTLERFPPDDVLWAGPTHGTHSARELRKVLAESKTPVIPALEGHILELGEGARLQVLSAGSRGAVLLLEWGDFRALLPVGLDFESMEELQNDPDMVPVAILLLAESGYVPLNPPEWIDRWNPQLVVLSVAAGDRDGLPAPETLEAVADYSLLRTDLNGWVHLSTDGEQMWVEVERR